MEQIFSQMEGRLEVSLTDSIMMWIVHCAMNKAQEKMKSKKGVLERLNAISKFYELAVMQLEGCLSFVGAETERNNFLDTNHEEVLADLREIRDRLQGRLEESEMAISKKDRELTERLENELKLRQALELKDGEIVSLGADIELEKTRRRNEDSDGGYCETKSFIDQQMLNIDERLEPHGNIVGEVPRSGIDEKVEEMGSDIDILKQTLDVAFGKIQSVLFCGEMVPKEQEWKLTTEKEILSMLVKSYMIEFQEDIEAEVRTQGKQVLKRWYDHWAHMTNEFTSLRHEIELLGTFSEDSNAASPILSQESIWHKISPEKLASPECGHDESKRHLDEKSAEEEGNKDGSNFVAKMVKKHQSIIRQKSQELNIPIPKVGGSLHEKKSSPTKKDKGASGMKERIQNITGKLENLIKWNSKVGESLFDQKVFHDEIDEVKKGECTLESAWEKIRRVNEEQDDKRVLNKEKEDKMSENKFPDKGLAKEFHTESFDFDIEKQIEEGVCKYYLKEVIEEWNESIERNSIENQIKEDIGMLVFSKMVDEHNKTLQDYNASKENILYKIQDHFLEHLQLVLTESLLKEDLCMVALRGMLMEWETKLDDYYIENLIRGDLHQIITVETMKGAIIGSMEVNSPVEGKIMEEEALSSTLLNQVDEVQSEERLIKILLESLLTCLEAEESLMLSARSEIKEHSRQLDLGSERGELHEHEIFEDLLIGEEQTFYSLTSKVENALQQLGTSKALLCELVSTLSLRLCDSQKNNNQTAANDGIEEEQSKTSYSDFWPLLNFLETFTEFESKVNQKIEMETLRLENMKYCLDPVVESVNSLRSKEAFAIRCQNIQKAEFESTANVVEGEQSKPSYSHFWPLLNFLETFTEFEGMVNRKIEMETLRLENMKSYLDPVVESVNSLSKKALTIRCQKAEPQCVNETTANAIEGEQLKPSYSDFWPLLNFLQSFTEFEGMANQKIEIETLRLENMKYCLEPVIKSVNCLRSKESIFLKAFTIRCQNLQKAELEVDLLGDQVDALLALLEKIHATLYKYAPVLQQYFEVSKILELIKKELTSAAV